MNRLDRLLDLELQRARDHRCVQQRDLRSGPALDPVEQQLGELLRVALVGREVGEAVEGAVRLDHPYPRDGLQPVDHHVAGVLQRQAHVLPCRDVGPQLLVPVRPVVDLFHKPLMQVPQVCKALLNFKERRRDQFQ